MISATENQLNTSNSIKQSPFLKFIPTNPYFIMPAWQGSDWLKNLHSFMKLNDRCK